jgi:cytoskeletal protein CcmA (bactofilin family)
MLRGIGGRRSGTGSDDHDTNVTTEPTQHVGEDTMTDHTRRDPIAATHELNALLGRGSEFDGKLAFEGTVRIDGSFSGEITTSDTLIVGDGAKVHAEISCGSIVVHGEIVGNITASQSVELHKPARVKGDIATPSLSVERGVLFQGNSKMEEAASSNVVRFGERAESAEA